MIKAFLDTDKSLNSSLNINTNVSGSTCVTVVVTQSQVLCANLGDSCAGLVSEPKTGEA